MAEVESSSDTVTAVSIVEERLLDAERMKDRARGEVDAANGRFEAKYAVYCELSDLLSRLRSKP